MSDLKKKGAAEDRELASAIGANLISLPSDPYSTYVYGCSPNKGGNSDFASLLIEGELGDMGVDFDGTFLREHKINPCKGCQACVNPARLGKLCVFSGKDDGEKLFDPLLGSKTLFFVAPIYFYHLPALFKGLIDRCQPYWSLRRQGHALLNSLPRRKAHVVLLCAREKGEKMFQGSLLTLRFFLEPFNIELAEPLLLRGLEGATDLASDRNAQEELIRYVRQACQNLDAGLEGK